MFFCDANAAAAGTEALVLEGAAVDFLVNEGARDLELGGEFGDGVHGLQHQGSFGKVVFAAIAAAIHAQEADAAAVHGTCGRRSCCVVRGVCAFPRAAL